MLAVGAPVVAADDVRGGVGGGRVAGTPPGSGPRWRRRDIGRAAPRIVAVVTALLGVAWLANDWIGWDGGPAARRSLAAFAGPFLVPLIVHLALAYPAGRVHGHSAWVLLGVSTARQR